MSDWDDTDWWDKMNKVLVTRKYSKVWLRKTSDAAQARKMASYYLNVRIIE